MVKNENIFDLFVSFASADDAGPNEAGRWVSSLVTRLTHMVAERLGRDLRVFFDTGRRSRLSGTLDPSTAALRGSALLIPVLSPAYTSSSRCQRELQMFLERHGTERILKVMRTPVVSEPADLREISGFKFFDPETDTAQELMDRRYFAVLDRLAAQIVLLLTSVGKGQLTSAAATSKMEVFLCHASGDKPRVRSLWRRLQQDGFAPWLDEEALVPGQHWDSEIRNAIDRAGAIVICLSESSINKEGYLQREIRLVLDRASEIPEEVIFLIPARLEECSVPRRLSALQWVNLFEDSGYTRLLQALNMRAKLLHARSG